MASKRKREEEEEEKQVRGPINTDNIHTLYVGSNGYEARPEHEAALPPASSWWESARLRPVSCEAMETDEALIWRALNAGRHVLISGKAGAGKSHLLQRFVARLRQSHLPFDLTAPTGIASYNVGGETMHRRLGLGIAREDGPTLWKKLNDPRTSGYYQKTRRHLTECRLLIIDEVSMVNPDFWSKWDYLFRRARNSDRPFGGVQLVLVGDFTQLGPIQKDEEGGGAGESERFILDTAVWQQMSFSRVFLDRSYRQAAGPFLELLNEVREGQLSDASREVLMSRIGVDLDVSTTVSVETPWQSGANEGPDPKPTKTIRLEPPTVYPHNSSVDRYNTTRLEQLCASEKVEVKRFYPAFRVARKDQFKSIDPSDLKHANELMNEAQPGKKGFGPSKLEQYFPVFHVKLAVGAQVMMRSNRHIDVGIVNGSVGVVTGIGDNFISVLFLRDGTFMDKSLDIERVEFFYPAKTAEIVMTQFPLSLAWACSIHKVQGLTLERIRIDARNMFDAGMLYVALSRVRAIEHLSLIGFNERSLITDPRAVEFETRK